MSYAKIFVSQEAKNVKTFPFESEKIASFFVFSHYGKVKMQNIERKSENRKWDNPCSNKVDSTSRGQRTRHKATPQKVKPHKATPIKASLGQCDTTKNIPRAKWHHKKTSPGQSDYTQSVSRGKVTPHKATPCKTSSVKSYTTQCDTMQNGPRPQIDTMRNVPREKRCHTQ